MKDRTGEPSIPQFLHDVTFHVTEVTDVTVLEISPLPTLLLASIRNRKTVGIWPPREK
jgi:hypothetical protein